MSSARVTASGNRRRLIINWWRLVRGVAALLFTARIIEPLLLALKHEHGWGLGLLIAGIVLGVVIAVAAIRFDILACWAVVSPGRLSAGALGRDLDVVGVGLAPMSSRFVASEVPVIQLRDGRRAAVNALSGKVGARRHDTLLRVLRSGTARVQPITRQTLREWAPGLRGPWWSRLVDHQLVARPSDAVWTDT